MKLLSPMRKARLWQVSSAYYFVMTAQTQAPPALAMLGPRIKVRLTFMVT